jgi:hypothetical protein
VRATFGKTPPDLVPFTAFDGDWPAYEIELHRIFIVEIANCGVQFDGLPVGCRRHPEAAPFASIARWAPTRGR